MSYESRLQRMPTTSNGCCPACCYQQSVMLLPVAPAAVTYTFLRQDCPCSSVAAMPTFPALLKLLLMLFSVHLCTANKNQQQNQATGCRSSVPRTKLLGGVKAPTRSQVGTYLQHMQASWHAGNRKYRGCFSCIQCTRLCTLVPAVTSTSCAVLMQRGSRE